MIKAIYLAAFVAGLIECRNQCVGLNGKDSFYCVCNTTYCDDIPVLNTPEKGSLLAYETSKSGHRFFESSLKFGPSNGSHAADHIVVTVDHNQRHHKWIGLGAAFTDSAVITIDSLPKEMAQHVIRDYFANTGLEFSVARIPMAGSDFSTRWYTYDDIPEGQQDFELKNWKLQDEDIKHKIPNIKLAKSVAPRPIKFFGTPWYSPKWITNKTSLAQNHDKHFTTWANYLVKFLDEYKKNDIDMWGMTIHNEPYHQWPFEMGFEKPAVERDFLNKYFGPALVKAGYTKDNFNLMLFDEGSNIPPAGKPDNPLSIIHYMETFYNDTDTAKYAKGIAYHCYGSNPNFAPDLLKKYRDLFIMMTECCLGFTTTPPKPAPAAALGDWGQAESYITGVISNMKNDVQGWTEWNLALDTLGHPNQEGYRSDAPVVIDAAKKVYYKNPNFYALGQMSKFVVPDSVRLGVTLSKTANRFDAIAYQRPDNTTALLIYNLDNKPVDLIIEDPTRGQVVTKIQEHSIQSYLYQ